MPPSIPEAELLQIGHGFIMASTLLSVMLLALLLPLGKAFFDPRRPFGGTVSDRIYAAACYLALFLGLLAWAWHTAFPVSPWRWVIVRDIAYHTGWLLGLYALLILGIVKFVVDPQSVLKNFHHAHKRIPGKRRPVVAVILVGAMMLGFLGWNSYIFVQDIRDIFSTPVIAVDRLSGFHRAYRSLEGSLYFDQSGSLVVVHGTTLNVWKNQNYQVTYTPHRRLIVSCRQP